MANEESAAQRRAAESSDGSAPPGSLSGRLRARVAGLAAALVEGERSALTKLAGTAFLIRALSAAIAFVSQIFIARWMGAFEFGIYVYVWTWTVVLGLMAPLGLGSASQRFLPEYGEHGRPAQLKGFLRASRWTAFAVGTVLMLLGIAFVWLLRAHIEDYYLLPFLIALACLPIYAVSEVQDGIARTYDWVGLALVPIYIVNPLLIVASLALCHWLGLPATAPVAITAASLGVWVTTLGQIVELQRRLKRRLPEVAPVTRVYEHRRWLTVALPVFLVESFYLLLTSVDILVLDLFVPPDQVAVYYAATKVLAPMAFVYFSVSAAVTHKFTAFHVAGEREKLERFLADTIHWTFWPSLGFAVLLLILGPWLLAMFGAEFVAGYPLMFVLALGLLMRAAVGPVERLLVMLGEQNACAVIYALTFALNLGLCLLLIPHFGLMGAAMAPTIAYAVESVLLFVAARQRLGMHVFVLRRRGGKA